MQRLLKSAVLAALVANGSVAYAGGPVIIEEGNDEQIEANTVRSGGILPVLGVLLLVGLLAGGGGDGGGATPEPEPEPEKCPGGC